MMIKRAFEFHQQPLDEALHDVMFDRFLAHYEAHIADETVLFPGVEAALARFADQGLATGDMQQ